MEHQRTRAAAPFLQTDEAAEALQKRLPYLAAFYRGYYEGDFKKRIEHSNDPYVTFRLGSWSMETSLEKYREYSQFQGYRLLSTVQCPVLLVVGEKDLNVPPESVQRVILAQADQRSFSNVRAQVLANLEHSFREVLPGESWIDAMKKPISPLYLQALTEFVRLVSK